MDAVTDLTLAIPGYCLREQLYCSFKTRVYRAVREIDQCPVVIKLLRGEYTTFNDLLQFRNHYTIAKNIEHLGIVSTYSLEVYRNSYVLIMEDFGGICLGKYVQERALTLSEVLDIAIQLADILDGLYRHRVIHKNIKPANILINPETQQVKLIDFSIASLLPKETQEIQTLNVLEGTLAYISPEQTGRMNRGIDYRTDLYSLGITLYKLLTGQLPFQSEDPMELVHCHLAKQPSAPHAVNPDIPPILSQLVLKLMAKNAEERYHSALGLKHDLEACLFQLKKTGSIETFELGGRDICDRFLISEKLYGREKEVETLLASFERVSAGNAELMLVAGFSGIGKTAVVNEVHKPIVKQRGYFIKGKFDLFQRYIPLSAFVQALRDLIGQLLSESDAQLSYWKNKILLALGESAQVIIEVIPELELIIGPQPSVPELSGNAAQNRFNILFQTFLKVFISQEHPLVIFVDDLQWADSDSLKLMQFILNRSDTNYLLIIGAYRDNEVFPAHPLMLMLRELEKERVIFQTITLERLSLFHLNQLIAETLSCDYERALPLTQLVAQKTQGNPFFSTQFLKALHDDGVITFNAGQGYWECDITQIKAKALTDDVVKFMAQQLQKLSEITQQMLKLAACIGNQFDLETLAIVSQMPATGTAAALWEALEEGLIVPASELYKFYQKNGSSLSVMGQEETSPLSLKPYPLANYRFLHDQVQQAAYSLIPESQKRSTHLKIGQLLLNNTSDSELEEKIFDIVNQLNEGIESSNQPQEQEQLVQLNLIAGRKAKATNAYAAAAEYLKAGIKFLPVNSWDTHYQLTLALYEEVIEAVYLCGDFKAMEHWKDTLLSAAKTVLDKVKTYEVQIAASVAQNKLRDAISIALSVLTQLGIDFPQQPSPADWQAGIEEVTSHLAEKSIADALNLPLMSDPNSQAALRILLSIDAATYLSFPELLPLTMCKQVNLSLVFGNTAGSAKAYANYGLLLCSGMGDLEAGYQFGQLALNLLAKLEIKEIYARTSFIVNFFIKHWKDPLNQTLKPLQEAYTIGLETGDLIHAAIAAEKYCFHAYFSGNELIQLAKEMKMYADKMVQLKQNVALCTHEIHWQSVLNLIGEAPDPCRLSGQVCQETTILPIHLKNNTRTAILYIYFNKLMLCYLFGDYSQAVDNAELAKQYLESGIGQFIYALFYFYDSLIHLAIYPNSSQNKQDEILARVGDNQKKLSNWAHYAPMNFHHKHELVEAEKYRILNKKSEAIESYDTAIKVAKETEYLQEEALANELAAKFYLDWGKEKIAQSYMMKAYYCYARWGAKAKTEELEKRYPQLHGASILPALDFTAIFQASQALSREIYLDKLLTILLNTVIANAGASKCVLMLLWDNSLRVEAVTQLEQPVKIFQAIPVDDSTDIPISLIYTVKRTLQTVVIADAIKEAALLADLYIIQQQPSSLLCTPLLNQGKLIGILYLENHQTTGVFTKERVEILNFLCCQAAISIENARLYEQLKNYSHHLEIKVAERTAELEKVNRELYGIATLDGLTFIANRRHFDSYLKEQWQLLLLAKEPLGLLLCDIDYFKRYNDYYGHPAGDECLKQVAQLLSQLSKRAGDLVARYGGEEFAIILPNTDELGTRKVAERINLEINRLKMPHAKSPLLPYITLSAGGSSMVPRIDTSWETLIYTADQALYKAKNAGRNRYCIYEHY